jgi:hypothetical protein
MLQPLSRGGQTHASEEPLLPMIWVPPLANQCPGVAYMYAIVPLAYLI